MAEILLEKDKLIEERNRIISTIEYLNYNKEMAKTSRPRTKRVRDIINNFQSQIDSQKQRLAEINEKLSKIQSQTSDEESQQLGLC